VEEGEITDNPPPHSDDDAEDEETETFSTLNEVDVEAEKREEKREDLLVETEIEEIFESSRRKEPEEEEIEKRFPFRREMLEREQ
jgi:hypothetical protein